MADTASPTMLDLRSIGRALLLFGFVLGLQLGHLVEHIAKTVLGRGLLGREFDSELSHLLFNASVGLFALALVRVYPRNPWVYPLVIVSCLHGIEHAYIYQQFLEIGTSGGPGLLGAGGALGLIPLDRGDLHNIYNGVEMILMVLGFEHETDVRLFVAKE